MFGWLKNVFKSKRVPLKVSIMYCRLSRIYARYADKPNMSLRFNVSTCLGERTISLIEYVSRISPVKAYALHYLNNNQMLFSLYTVVDRDNQLIDIVEHIVDKSIDEIDVDLAILELEEIAGLNR